MGREKIGGPLANTGKGSSYDYYKLCMKGIQAGLPYNDRPICSVFDTKMILKYLHNKNYPYFKYKFSMKNV